MKTLLLSILTLASATSVFADVSKASKPNIIVFYTDDHGYADLGIQGIVNDIKTPNVDALARRGVLAKHGYSTAPECVPSRGGLMTSV